MSIQTMKKLSSIVLLASCSLFQPAANAESITNNSVEKTTLSDYQLVWSDEFDKPGKPDASKWGYEKGFARNHELQWYQEDNAFVEDGKLIIEAKRVKIKNPNFEKGSKNWRTARKYVRYTSSSLRTKDLHSWQYGRFEVRAKISAKDGLWPAIWFLGVEGNWPSNGEIDLMEYYQGDILANACWEAKKQGRAKWDAVHVPVKSFNIDDWDSRFHIWRMDWDENSIKLYVDDQLLNTIELSKTINKGGRGPENPFKQPHYMLLNLAIGGDKGGNPKGTAFPSRYEIDYVRVYQQQP